MDEGMHHSHRCVAGKLMLLGIVLILVSILKPTWNMWVVIGTLAVIKGIMMFLMPCCPCMKKAKGRK